MNISREGILVYADDLLVLCDNQEQLEKVIKLLKSEFQSVGLIMNNKKSAIIEFRNRHSKIQKLKVTSFGDIPVVNQYRYLGLIFDQKLSINAHLYHINKKISFQLHALTKILNNITAGYRKNLWMTFIKPLFELASLLYYTEPAKSNKDKLERCFYQSFKRIVGLGKTTPNTIVRELCGYQLKERAKELWNEATNKWNERIGNDIKIEKIIIKKQPNLLQYISQDGIKLVNLFNRVCPICKNTKMSVTHLIKHRIYAPEVKDLFTKINEEVEETRREAKKQKISLPRGSLISLHNGRCVNIIKEINKFITCSL